MELAVRADEHKKIYYMINHTDTEKEVFFPFDGEELTERLRIKAGDKVRLGRVGVKVISVNIL